MARKILDYKSGKKSQTDDLINATAHFVRRMRFQNAYKVPYTTLVETTWNEEHRKTIEDASRLIPPTQLVEAHVIFRDTFPMHQHPAMPPNAQVFEDVSFTIQQPQGPVRFWPQHWMIGAVNIPGSELRRVCSELLQDTLDRYAVKHALTALRYKCETHEQAIFLMPFWRNVLKQAGLWDLVDVAVDRMPPGKTILTEQDRRAIRHANTVLASHTLLGTFDGSFTHQQRDNENCTVAFYGNQDIAFETEAGIQWSVTLES